MGKEMMFFVFLICLSLTLMSNLKCHQNIIFLDNKLEAVCVTTCYVNEMLIGNSSCLSVRTAFLISLSLKTEGFREMSLVNLTTTSHKLTYLRVLINYYFRGVMLRALIAKKWHFASRANSPLECWLEGHNSGGSITIMTGGQKFLLQLRSGIVAVKWRSVGKDKNKTLEILNQKFNYDCYFVAMICPHLSDEIYQRKVLNPNFTIVRNETIYKRFLRKTWKSSWLDWYKYKELEDLSASYGGKNVIFLNDYESFLDQTQATTIGVVFLVGGSAMVLFLFFCLSIVNRRKVDKNVG